MENYDYRRLKDYKGYEIYKCYWTDETGKKSSNYFYLVAENDDYIGESYLSLDDAKSFIDSVTK